MLVGLRLLGCLARNFLVRCEVDVHTAHGVVARLCLRGWRLRGLRLRQDSFGGVRLHRDTWSKLLTDRVRGPLRSLLLEGTDGGRLVAHELVTQGLVAQGLVTQGLVSQGLVTHGLGVD